MKAFGTVTRGGPNGWEITQRFEGSIGKLPQTSDGWEVFRQAAELLLSDKREGTICGNRILQVRPDSETGARTLLIKLPLVWIKLKKNSDPNRRAEVLFFISDDFEFPREEDQF